MSWRGDSKEYQPKYAYLVALNHRGSAISLQGRRDRHEQQAWINQQDGRSALCQSRCRQPSEQAEIVRRVESLFAYADRLEARYTTARAQVERLTPALLAKAFRGELVPQDPNDEPASVLLERIRAARAAAPAKPKRRRGAAVGEPSEDIVEPVVAVHRG